MSRAGAWVLIGLGLASALLGAFIGFGLGLPALGLNQHGRNSVEFTAIGEGIAAVFYFLGAVFQIQGARVAAQFGRPTRKVVLVVLIYETATISVTSAWLGIRHGDWEAVLLGLIFVVFVFAPTLGGMLSVWMGSRSPGVGGSGTAGRRSGSLLT